VIQIGTAKDDAQTFQGQRRYLIDVNLAMAHLEILQCWTARKIKKGPLEAYTSKVYCPEMPRD
jgi:hypothetical protein